METSKAVVTIQALGGESCTSAAQCNTWLLIKLKSLLFLFSGESCRFTELCARGQLTCRAVSQIGQQSLDPNMLCDVIIPASGSVVPLTQIAINPAYYKYQTCTCASGYDAHWVTSTHLK